jgi:hypothetical protein
MVKVLFRRKTPSTVLPTALNIAAILAFSGTLLLMDIKHGTRVRAHTVPVAAVRNPHTALKSFTTNTSHVCSVPSTTSTKHQASCNAVRMVVNKEGLVAIDVSGLMVRAEWVFIPLKWGCAPI